MAGRYTQVFTLTDIFNDKQLKNKLPLINFKEIEKENGKVSVRTRPKSINRLVFDTAKSSARGYYKPMEAQESGNTLIIGGTLVGNHDSAIDAVYNALLAQKDMMSFTVNNMDMMRDALKEAEKNKRRSGINSKLYLRTQSKQEIMGMTKPQVRALMDNIMENIFYGDDFPETQKKYGVEKLAVRGGGTYEQRQLEWKMRVGDM